MLSRGRRRLLFGSLAVTIGLSGFGVQPVVGPVTAAPAGAAEPDDGAGDDGSGAGGPLVRPDSVSAQVTARASGRRVEDLSQGDAFTQVFAEPDGSWTSESASEPFRAKDEESGE